MKYYKIKIGNDIIGVGSSLDFRVYQHKHQIVLISTEEEAQYIQFDEKLYHADWMKSVANNPLEYINADVIEIENEEYEILQKAVQTEKTIPEPIIPEPIPESVVTPHEDLEYVRAMKIKELSMDCQQAIINGFDYNENHYSMKIEDQIELQFQYQNAISNIPCEYHADGEAYREYSKEEILELYNLMNEHKRKHRVYFNVLKQEVNSLNTIEDINNVHYEL